MQSGLQGLLAGIKHHHSLGLVHNDISLGSITLVDEKLIIINFVNCRSIGQTLRYTDTKKKHHWLDPSVETPLGKAFDIDAF